MGAIKVKIENAPEIRIGFRYEEKKILLGKPKVLTQVTATQAFVKCADRVDVGTVYCSPTDQFEKAEGRKRALKRALVCWSRPVRRHIWNALWEATNRTGFIDGEHTSRDAAHAT